MGDTMSAAERLIEGPNPSITDEGVKFRASMVVAILADYKPPWEL